MVEELLNIQAVYERYRELEQCIKQGMVELKFSELEIAGKGRVFISQSERVTVSPALAREVLDEALANMLIQITESVPNDLIKALVQVGKISQAQREALLAGAERTPVVSLYVRPLK